MLRKLVQEMQSKLVQEMLSKLVQEMLSKLVQEMLSKLLQEMQSKLVQEMLSILVHEKFEDNGNQKQLPAPLVVPVMLHLSDMIIIRVITKLPNSEQSCKGKVKTHNYVNKQN